MPKTLSAALVLEKNKVASASVWFMLAEIDLNGTLLRITNNNADVLFNGENYTPFPFEVSSMDNNSSGKVPSLSLNVSNVTKAVQHYVEASQGLVDSIVKIMVVNSDNLTEDYTELTLNYTIINTSVSPEWVTFKLGAPNPMMQRYPKDRYLAKYCNWTYNSPAVRAAGENLGIECGYTGALTSCDRTQEDCEAHSNVRRFGGYPGLSENGLRVIK